MDAEWIDPFPVHLRDTGRKVRGFPPWRLRTEYEYTADTACPMTLRWGGDFIRPDRHGFTDMGSIPEILQPIISKDLHLPSFIIHDSGCRERGLYFSSLPGGEYRFIPLCSARVHLILRVGLIAAGYDRRAWVVWAAVRAFGPRFDVGDEPPDRPDVVTSDAPWPEYFLPALD